MKLIPKLIVVCVAPFLLVPVVLGGAIFLGAWEIDRYSAPIGPIALTVNAEGDQIIVVDICRSRPFRGVWVREVVESGTEPIGTWHLANAVDEGRVELNLAHPSAEWIADGPSRLDKPDARYTIYGWGDDDRITDTISAETRLLQSLDPSKAVIGYEDIGPVDTDAGAMACAGRR